MLAPYMGTSAEIDNIKLLELKTQILMLEEQLRNEHIKYRQTKLKEQISELQKKYMEKDVYNLPVINETEYIVFDFIDDYKENVILNVQSNIIEITPENLPDINFKKNYKKVILKNIEHLDNQSIMAEIVEIIDCHDLNLIIRAETIVFRDLHQSNFVLESKQLRIQNTKDVEIILKTETSIALENCSSLRFKGHNGLKIPDDCINDFDYPLNSPNFTILKE
ncbi:Beta-tubulin folding cofactor C [Pseudoloma neurophilia]|uniref:Beta-tubulin folding cofactor C n=1 Tax=Pseudoloma neurophilia TaxID=146866 RepID=A0A0R0LRL6_9MICR|nr:Beta-tubulin folding cofactor C [Pseudoloma neurophilia]